VEESRGGTEGEERKGGVRGAEDNRRGEVRGGKVSIPALLFFHLIPPGAG
jgi:hypothetical protein